MATKLITPVFRVSFPSVFAASAYEGGVPKFSVCAVWEPAKFTPRDKQLWASMQNLADEVSMDKFKKKLAALSANFKKPFRDGEEKAELSGFGDGKVFCNLSSKQRPGLIGLNGNPIIDPEDFYPGCYARATITAYAYDNVGKGVALGLQNLQKIKDGERLDNRTDPNDDFGGAEVDDAWLGDDGTDPLA
jgi:hypothetical protein